MVRREAAGAWDRSTKEATPIRELLGIADNEVLQ